MNSNISYDPDAMAQEYADKAHTNINFNQLNNSSLQTNEAMTQENKETAKSDQTLKNDRTRPFTQTPFEIKPNRHGIAIEITAECPMKKASLEYVLYQIQGFAEKRKFETKKGYHDFAQLREKLVKNWFGCRIPALPRANIWLNYQPGDAEARRNDLAKFLKEIAESPHLYNSADFQKFLKSGPGSVQETTYSMIQDFEMLKPVNNMNAMPNFPQLSEKIESLQIPQHNSSQNQIPSITIIGDFQRANSLGVLHKEYHIRGFDEKGMFEVNRRYSDFVLIREILVNNWPGVKFQELPSTLRFNGETEEAFQNIRSHGLINFLQSITLIDSVFHSSEWQTFIKDSSPKIADKLKFFKKTRSIFSKIFGK